MTRPALTQRELALVALLDARGQIVSVPDLLDAVYPPGVSRPASEMFATGAIIRKLRAAGHDVQHHKGLGYSLARQGVAAAPVAVCRSDAARLAEDQGRLCGLCGEPTRRLRVFRFSRANVPGRMVCAKCDDLPTVLSNPALRPVVLSLMERLR